MGLLQEDGKPKYLRHYTQLPYLLKILETGKLRLSKTSEFCEHNDKEWAEQYKKKTSAQLYALCCTWETELIHHWYTYASGKFGCYLMLEAAPLIETAQKNGIRHGFVKYMKNIPYKTIADKVQPEEIPFAKAWAYRCEYEYRFISGKEKNLTFGPETVKQVTITSAMDDTTFDYFKGVIAKVYSGEIHHSRLEKD